MHSAPAVTYPVGRSRLHGALLVGIALATSLVGLLWRNLGSPENLHQGFFAMAAIGFWLLSFQAWRRTPDGKLHWDGQAWSWTSGATLVAGMVGIHLDLQFCMVLSLGTGDGTRVWLWPERNSDPMHWNALRRAVFSPVARAADGSAGTSAAHE